MSTKVRIFCGKKISRISLEFAKLNSCEKSDFTLIREIKFPQKFLFSSFALVRVQQTLKENLFASLQPIHGNF